MKLWGNCVPVSNAAVSTLSPALNRWEHRHFDSSRCPPYRRTADFLTNTQSARDTFTLSEAKLSHRGPTLVPISLGAPLSCPTISRCPSALDAALLPEDQCCCRNNRKQERKHALSLDSKNGVTHALNLLVLNRKDVILFCFFVLFWRSASDTCTDLVSMLENPVLQTNTRLSLSVCDEYGLKFVPDQTAIHKNRNMAPSELKNQRCEAFFQLLPINIVGRCLYTEATVDTVATPSW